MFSPYYHTKSLLPRIFYTLRRKNPLSFIMISVYHFSIRSPKFQLSIIILRARTIDLPDALVSFLPVRTATLLLCVRKGKRLPCDFAGAEQGLAQWNGNNKRCGSETTKRFTHNCHTRSKTSPSVAEETRNVVYSDQRINYSCARCAQGRVVCAANHTLSSMIYLVATSSLLARLCRDHSGLKKLLPAEMLLT